MTTLYANQRNIPRISPTNMDEIKKNCDKMYWSSRCGIEMIKGCMSLIRFYKLRQTLHLLDTSSEGTRYIEGVLMETFHHNFNNLYHNLKTQTS